MSKQTIAIYRMPNEEDYYSLTSEEKLVINSEEKNGFFFSNFDTGTTYTLSNPTSIKNSWPSFEPFLNSSDEEISKENYISKVSQIVEEIKTGRMKKVVFSRIQNVYKSNSFELEKAFKDLCENYPQAFVYCISSEENGTWMGASPELLMKKNEETFKTVSLAGTRTEGVNWTTKEREEQQVVTDYILDKINSFSSSVKVSKPYDLDTGAVIHLKSDIEFSLGKNSSLWNLVSILHPTPAVCGMPTKDAKQLIGELEPQKRNLYTGFIGPMGINNHSSLFVNLRCMQVCSDAISLYLGGGIMGESSPEKEWIETQNKAKTLSRVL